MSLLWHMTVSANQSCVGRAMMLSLLCCPAGRHQYLYARSSCSSFPFPSGLRPHSRVVSNLDQSSDCCVDCILLLLCVVQKQLHCAAVVAAPFEGPLLPGRPWPFSGGFAFLSDDATDATACGVMGECEQTECDTMAQ